MSDGYTLDGIVELLDRHRQRATYGAVAGLLGSSPQSVLNDRPRTPFYSWVVNAKTSMPTGYAPDERHPELQRNARVLRDERELRDWLERLRDADETSDPTPVAVVRGSVRLSPLGRLAHALAALLLLVPVPRHLAAGDWLGLALSALGLVFLGLPAVFGRNPMVDPTVVSRWARWVYETEEPKASGVEGRRQADG